MKYKLPPLTAEEQLLSRAEFKDKEKEIQKYISVYLSALVVVTGWIIGPQAKGMIEIALGNEGQSVFGIFVIVGVNIVFSCFLTYKSIIIHEIMQFVTYLSPPSATFHTWDAWRSSPQGATRPVRAVYTLLISLVPIFVSSAIMFGLYVLLHTDPSRLVKQAAGSVSVEALRVVFTGARVVWWVFLLTHLIPLWFFYENVVPTRRRWAKIAVIHPDRVEFGTVLMDPFSTSAPERAAESGSSDPATGGGDEDQPSDPSNPPSAK